MNEAATHVKCSSHFAHYLSCEKLLENRCVSIIRLSLSLSLARSHRSIKSLRTKRQSCLHDASGAEGIGWESTLGNALQNAAEQ